MKDIGSDWFKRSTIAWILEFSRGQSRVSCQLWSTVNCVHCQLCSTVNCVQLSTVFYCKLCSTVFNWQLCSTGNCIQPSTVFNDQLSTVFNYQLSTVFSCQLCSTINCVQQSTVLNCPLCSTINCVQLATVFNCHLSTAHCVHCVPNLTSWPSYQSLGSDLSLLHFSPDITAKLSLSLSMVVGTKFLNTKRTI